MARALLCGMAEEGHTSQLGDIHCYSLFCLSRLRDGEGHATLRVQHPARHCREAELRPAAPPQTTADEHKTTTQTLDVENTMAALPQ
jgi:hypothetical protein